MKKTTRMRRKREGKEEEWSVDREEQRTLETQSRNPTCSRRPVARRRVTCDPCPRVARCRVTGLPFVTRCSATCLPFVARRSPTCPFLRRLLHRSASRRALLAPPRPFSLRPTHRPRQRRELRRRCRRDSVGPASGPGRPARSSCARAAARGARRARRTSRGRARKAAQNEPTEENGGAPSDDVGSRREGRSRERPRRCEEERWKGQRRWEQRRRARPNRFRPGRADQTPPRRNPHRDRSAQTPASPRAVADRAFRRPSRGPDPPAALPDAAAW